jgi:uracil-DNA glycosylase
LAHCRPYLERELEILKPRAILALGKIGWDVYLGILKAQGFIVSRAAFPFGHGTEVDLPSVGARLFGVYHPSQQNTSTGKVTLEMYAKVLGRVKKYLKAKA